MKGWVCQSNAASMPGHRFTLGITCQVQPSQAQQCHPHPQARHQGETHAPRASLSTDPVPTLLTVEPIFPPCTNSSLLCVNISIQDDPRRQHSSSSQWIYSLVQLWHSPQHTNAFDSISHRGFCWIKASLWLQVSHSSTKMATKSRTPLPLQQRRASSTFHNVCQAHINFCQLSSHWAQQLSWNRLYREREGGKGFPHLPIGWGQTSFVAGLGFYSFGFCFAYVANCPFPRAAQLLSSPATLNLCSLYSYSEVANRRSRNHFASVKDLKLKVPKQRVLIHTSLWPVLGMQCFLLQAVLHSLFLMICWETKKFTSDIKLEVENNRESKCVIQIHKGRWNTGERQRK